MRTTTTSFGVPVYLQEIAELKAEIERLREALRVIRDMAICEEGETADQRMNIVDACRDVAREALKQSQP